MGATVRPPGFLWRFRLRQVGRPRDRCCAMLRHARVCGSRSHLKGASPSLSTRGYRVADYGADGSAKGRPRVTSTRWLWPEAAEASSLRNQGSQMILQGGGNRSPSQVQDRSPSVDFNPAPAGSPAGLSGLRLAGVPAASSRIAHRTALSAQTGAREDCARPVREKRLLRAVLKQRLRSRPPFGWHGECLALKRCRLPSQKLYSAPSSGAKAQKRP